MVSRRRCHECWFLRLKRSDEGTGRQGNGRLYIETYQCATVQGSMICVSTSRELQSGNTYCSKRSDRRVCLCVSRRSNGKVWLHSVKITINSQLLAQNRQDVKLE